MENFDSIQYGNWAFYNCISMKGNGAIGKSAITGNQMYYECRNLERFEFHDNGQEFLNLNWAFYNCHNMVGEAVAPYNPKRNND